jgi:transposase-like protein
VVFALTTTAAMDNSAPFLNHPVALIYRGISVQINRATSVFPSDDSARKVVYLAIGQASCRWTMPIQNWKAALNRFVLEFGERITIHSP